MANKGCSRYTIDVNGYSFVDARMKEHRISATGCSDIQITGYPDVRNPASVPLERCEVYYLYERRSTIQ